jgi:uncharacterized protein (DUF2235 family)
MATPHQSDVFTPLRTVVMCFDGTGNEISKPHTNVYRIFQASDVPGVLRFYHPGVNTLVNASALYKGAKFSSWVRDSATGGSIRIAFLAGYQFLIDNAHDGDDIYIFGFSRGSFAARMLAGAVKMFGIPKPEHACVLPYIWQAYIGAALRPGAGKDESIFPYAGRIKRDFGRHVNFRFRFLGVWDTVASFGSIVAFKALPFTRHNEDIHIVRHAVSVDEHRSVFDLNKIETITTQQDVKQVWFAGCHCDIGGGHAMEEAGLAMISFDWMIEEAKLNGLTFDPATLSHFAKECASDPGAKFHESMDPMYGFIEFLPIRKYDFEAKGEKFHAPHLFQRRIIDPNDTIHPTVYERMEKVPGYRPKNVRPKSTLPTTPTAPSNP